MSASSKKNKQHRFTLVLSGVNSETESLEDVLFESGCDDVLIHFRNGTVFLDFDRESENFDDAVIAAIKQVENTALPIHVAHVAPDHYVSESDVAKRLHIKRQTVSLWFKRERHSKHPFPSPIMKLNEKSPLWRWSDVVEWLYQQKKIKDEQILNNAKFIEHINIVLLDRALNATSYRRKLIKKLN
ncbi:MAG: hypothetical protein A3C44_02140 [Gammaproteobacteria bacterium RIFCSPHIGHO2_02_FULL_39_13]|nr:MAG: hypothetical protein A3C44_02140 [Gammaproteobacteria bacterium RIFCSPHIGHO2_02_FULL_39_13]OGT48336.1 MAG: hypothetical protein A3E53_05835 [Gammaproteobacteria bacterium RIFCSPHIGHO2_12_FULL_39_24]